MFRAAWALLAAAAVSLLPNAASGQVTRSEFDDLEREFDSLAYGNHKEHYRHGHHRHSIHHHPHLRRHKRTSLFAEGPVTLHAGTTPAMPAPPPRDGLLPGRYPAVARKLGHMEEEMRDLKGTRHTAGIARNKLEQNVQKAVLHMNEAVSIKRELARTEVQIRAEEIKLKKLEDDRLRLDRTHGHLVSSLHHIMEPKIQFAETRLTQRQRNLRSLETKAVEWKAKETKFHEASLAMIDERRADKLRFDAATEAVEKARHEQEVAGKQLEGAKHKVTYDVEGYRYAQARTRGAVSEQERSVQEVHDAERSLKRLNGILNMEQKRVDESMAIGKDRVQGKMRELENKKENSKIKLSDLSKEYSSWQEEQRSFARRVAASHLVSHDTSHDYAERQQSVLDAAQAKVAYDAESDSDWAWDDWAAESDGPSQRNTDEVQLSAI